ncbi:FAD-dependent oxidoreductase [Roseomonas sp. BN140053]|uniref:FAD-dependent oxidoreductase n=1 Tax=Roseomonas sp. BN140053 TaxID=3391898 RepID=UPI0039EC7C9D
MNAIPPPAYALPTFPYRRAPEQDGARPRRPVAVVGGGLSGLTAACDLAVRGIPVVLLDEDDTVGVRGASSRGICYAQRSLEIFERLGLYDRVRDKGVTWSVGRVMLEDEELYNFDLALGSASRQPPFVNLQQFYVEWFLVDRLAELPLADLRWKNRVVGAEQFDDHVLLQVETPEGAYPLEAAWVIDASGLASPLRGALGAQARSSPGVDRWCISDVRFSKPLPPERWTWVQAAFNEGRAVWQHQMADGVWRIDYQLDPNSDPAEASLPEVVQKRLAAHLGADTEFETVWVGPWGYRTHLLDDFRNGRVFFAGDAAHVFSPFGARGGNSGIQDAENIAWKLAAVIRGEAGEALLDTYSAERRPAAQHNIRTTERSARFLAPRSRFERALRDAVLDLAREHAFARHVVNMGRMSDPFRYADSPLTTNGGEAVPNLRLRFADGAETSLAALLRGEGARFLLLAGAASGVTAAPASVAVGAPSSCAAASPVPNAAASSAPVVATSSVPVVTAFAAGGASGQLPVLLGPDLGALLAPEEALLIRPDGHLAARLRAPTPEDLAAALRRALGAPA